MDNNRPFARRRCALQEGSDSHMDCVILAMKYADLLGTKSEHETEISDTEKSLSDTEHGAQIPSIAPLRSCSLPDAAYSSAHKQDSSRKQRRRTGNLLYSFKPGKNSCVSSHTRKEAEDKVADARRRRRIIRQSSTGSNPTSTSDQEIDIMSKESDAANEEISPTIASFTVENFLHI
mmetsp:Transcript_6601/g.15095  ORF Transcript_6601/g.15095 Transcript_6601/m.15095 type:complete len:177 (-) Transcript_6601:46-576(-)|eukprot:755508-Hanusia_phi.AAC.4